MRPLPPGQGKPRIFEIKGWHEDASAQVAIKFSAEIATARRIISSQSNVLAERCKTLEQSLREAGIVDKALEASKVRPHFKLAITHAGDPPPQNWRSRGSESLPRREWEPAPADRQITDWLSASAPEGSTFVVSGLKPHEALARQLKSKGYKLLKLHGAEGSPTTAESGNPDRHRPQQGSLAQWLANTGPAARAGISGYILGRAATAIDCNLLRRRLHPGQFVCVELSSEATTQLAADWDGTIIEWPNHVLFIEPGPRYLDPVLIPPDRLHENDWPKISVVTVSFNQADFLEDCLLSVLDQDYPNLEYIVVDAVSTDGSQDILRRYEDRLSRLIIEPDEGQSDGLNKGLNLATGDILTWINSDDMLAPGALRRAALAFLDYDCDVVAGGCERITENSNTVTLRHHSALPYGRTVPLGFFEHFMWTNSWERGDYFFQPEVLFTADIWRRSGGYLKLHLHWAMDWELWIRMGLAGATVAHIPETIGRSREHPAQKTTSEERYLYQLNNILLEHDDALALLESSATDLPAGAMPGWVQFEAIRLPPRPAGLFKRIVMLRQPGRLRGAVKRRLPPRVVNLLRRIYGLRQPARLRAAVHRRLPPRSYMGWRLADLSGPWRTAVIRRLPPRLQDRLRHTRNTLRYGLGGPAVVSRVRLKELTRSREILSAAERDARAARAQQTELESQVAQLRLRCAELSEQCMELSDWRTTAGVLAAEYSRVSELFEAERERHEQEVAHKEPQRTREETELQRTIIEQTLDELSNAPAQLAAYREQLKMMLERFSAASMSIRERNYENERLEAEQSHANLTAKSLKSALDSTSNYATNLLFDRDDDPRTRQTMWTLLSSGTSVKDALRTIAIQCYEEQSKPTFPQRRDLLARSVEMPLLAGSEVLANSYTIVDIGAEPLSFESHIYAALPRRRPSLIIGFDPTDKEAPKTVVTGGSDGIPSNEVRTLPQFIGDGSAATFNLARMQPTSSLHKPNLTLAQRFSLLAEALEIVESKPVATHRLDDILATQDISGRPIDFLKIDVQGATLPVLHGACQTLSRSLVCHLEAEFSELYEGEALFNDVDRQMRLMGFALMDLSTLGRQRYNAFDATDERFFHAGRLLWADCVYVRHLDEPDKLSDAELLKLAEIAHVVYQKYDVAAFALQTLSRRADSSFYDEYVEIWG